MNGAPFWSPPNRHQKCLMTKLLSPSSGPEGKLSELPALVASAIKQGLIKRPDPTGTIPTPIKGELADWRTADCEECGVTFERGGRKITKCKRCRLEPKACSACGIIFRPPDRKKVCCSKECSQKKKVQNFKRKHALTAKPLGMVQCCICKVMRPEPKRGARIAQTCSKVCRVVLQKQKNQKTK